MSKLVNKIMATRTNKTKAIAPTLKLFDDICTVEEHIQYNSSTFQNEYEIGIKFGNKCGVNDNDSINLPRAIDSTKRQVIEAIFGEFREDMLMIERALHDRDNEKAMEALHVLRRKMFSPE